MAKGLTGEHLGTAHGLRQQCGVDLEWGEGDTGEGERQKSWDSHVNSLNNNKKQKEKQRKYAYLS